MPPRRQQHKIWNGKEVVVDCPWVGGHNKKSLVSRIIEILSPPSVTPKRAGNIEMNNLRRERGKKSEANPQVDLHSKVPSPYRVTRITSEVLPS